MKKIICIIDNDFYLTLPVVKSLKLFHAHLEEVNQQEFRIFFFHVLVTDKNNFMQIKQETDNNKKVFTERIKNDSKMVKVQYCPIIKKVEHRDYQKEAEDLIHRIENTIIKKENIQIKEWETVEKNQVLYLLDLALEFGDKEDDKTVVLLGKTMCYELKDKSLMLFSSFSDELRVWNDFQESYKNKYNEVIPSHIKLISRSDLNPRAFNTARGRDILLWNEK